MVVVCAAEALVVVFAVVTLVVVWAAVALDVVFAVVTLVVVWAAGALVVVWAEAVVPLEPPKRPLLAALMTGFLPFKKKNKS